MVVACCCAGAERILWVFKTNGLRSLQGDHSDLNVIEYVCALCPDIAKEKVYKKLIEFGFAVRKSGFQVLALKRRCTMFFAVAISTRARPERASTIQLDVRYFFYLLDFCFLQEDKKSPACIHSNITGLSGGWKMKLGNKICIFFSIRNLRRTAYIRAKAAPQHIHALNHALV